MNRDYDRDQKGRRQRRMPERYQNDDYSRYAGSEYRESEYDRDFGGNYGTNHFDYRESGTPTHPGVSGKSRGESRWINRPEYDQQRNFMGKGPKGYKRTDDRIYEEVCEALMRSHDIDASQVGVRVQEGIVTLEGQVASRQEKRAAEMEIEDLPGVLDVRNELKLFREGRDSGAAEAVKKHLGVEDRQNRRSM